MNASKLTAVLLAVIGSTLALIGVVVGMMPHSETLPGSFAMGTDCGSGFSPNPYITFTTQCIADTDGARSLALTLLIPGLLLLAVAGWLALYQRNVITKHATA